MQKAILYLSLFLFPLSGIAQSPWVNKKGSIYGQVSSSYLDYNKIYNGLGNVVGSPYTTTDLTVGLFGEYSITDKTSVLVDLPFKSVQSNDQSLSGIGDTKIKLKHQLSTKVPLAIHGGYTAPLSQRKDFLRTGYKQHAIDLGLSIGLGKKKFYTYASLSYSYRTNIPDQIIADAEFGYITSFLKRDLYLMFHFSGTVNTSYSFDSEAAKTMLYHNNAEYLSPGLKLSYNPAGNFWLNLGANSALNASNVPAVRVYSIGLAYSLKK